MSSSKRKAFEVSQYGASGPTGSTSAGSAVPICRGLQRVRCCVPAATWINSRNGAKRNAGTDGRKRTKGGPVQGPPFMPIRKDLRRFYSSPEWKEIRERIRKRSGNRCENCGKPNDTIVFTYTWRVRLQWSGRWEYFMVWCPESFQTWWPLVWKTQDGAECNLWNYKGLPRRLRVVLTVAHLDHDHANNSDDNLRCLCCWCHLTHDLLSHKRSRSTRKDARRAILQTKTFDVADGNVRIA
jgi:hypothetical protein